MKQEEIKKKIEEVREKIISTEVDLVNYDYLDKLLDIEVKLWNMLYFHVNQEKGYLLK